MRSKMYEQQSKRQRACDLLCAQVDLRQKDIHSGRCSEQDQ
uniref:Uncharacterized protein n=1 Tax=Lepeophtheirus salmonis TaxID=72036 RepID=A0A0K2SYP3_LEPSM